ncbi:MAG: hypothetical protein JOZ01_07675, partial [Candidatus Eremiobacteraeota bacterium]|nr:hypothetical protein [Candidatus Eremiobacteraeota bacterium]
MSDALDRLAEFAGIDSSFADYFGNETPVSDETKRALLAAMGYGVASEPDVARALADAVHAEWMQVVPAVTVVRPGDSAGLVCSLPFDSGETMAWTIVCEDGTRRSGGMR